jgi:hypothetical protein
MVGLIKMPMGWVKTQVPTRRIPLKAFWHGDVDLEVVLGWHAFTYLCTLLRCFKDVPQTSVDDGDPHDVDMELEGNGAMDI